MRLPSVILPNILALQRTRDRTFLLHGDVVFEDAENKLHARVTFDAAPLLLCMKKQNQLGGRVKRRSSWRGRRWPSPGESTACVG